MSSGYYTIPTEVDNKEIIKNINLYTGGKIGTYEWWIIKDASGKNIKVIEKPDSSIKIIDHLTLSNSFLTMDNEYIGDLDSGKRYLKNNIVVTKKYPNYGVAKVATHSLKEINRDKIINGILSDEFVNSDITNFPEEFLKGYYGYSHRGGQLFKIGDRIFDEKWRPTNEEIENNEEYQKIIKKYNDDAKRTAQGDPNPDSKDKTDQEKVVDNLSFNKRGSKVIETWEEAELAAKNISMYLS